MGRRVFGGALVALGFAAAGCAALLDVGDVGYVPADGAVDATAGGDASAGDGSALEGSTGDGGDAGADACSVPPNLSLDCDGGLLRCTAGDVCRFLAASDTHHCGECARACDRMCMDGLCEVVLLALPASSGIGRVFAVDESQVYWAEDGKQAFALPLDGGGAGVRALTGAYGAIFDLTVAVDGYYHLSTGGLETTTLDGSVTHLRDVNGSAGARVALAGVRLYYTEGQTGAGVATVLLDGGAPIPLAEGQNGPTDLFLAGDVVFYAVPSDKQIRSVDLASAGSPSFRFAVNGELGDMVGRGGWGYYALRNAVTKAFEIWRFDTTEANIAPVLVVGGLGVVAHLGVDDTYVYFSGYPGASGNGIYRVPKCGGDVSLVVSDVKGDPTGLALSRTRVAWSNGSALYVTNK